MSDCIFVVHGYGKVYHVSLFQILIDAWKERVLKGAMFFLSFFIIFALLTYLIAAPMFPSDIVINWASASALSQATLICALINGIIYGFIAWAVFVTVMGRISREKPAHSSQSQVKNQSRAKSKRRSKNLSR